MITKSFVAQSTSTDLMIPTTLVERLNNYLDHDVAIITPPFCWANRNDMTATIGHRSVNDDQE